MLPAMTELFRAGRLVPENAAAQAIDSKAISEHVTSSWYADSTNSLTPDLGLTQPQYPKNNAYSWIKAPRYSGVPYETGSLARMSVNKEYAGGISVMDRHLARAHESLKIAEVLQVWVEQLSPDGPVCTECPVPASATSCGLIEAPRGALGHWVQISNSKISRYQIITPTCWNASPGMTAQYQDR